MTSGGLFRTLLKLYPAPYRREYGQAMTQCFRDQLRTADTAGKRLRLWLRTLADLVQSVPARYLEVLYQSDLARHGTSNTWNAYSEGARRSLYSARLEASCFNAEEISLEQLLLGTLHNDQELATALLGLQGMNTIAEAIQGRRPVPRNPLFGNRREGRRYRSCLPRLPLSGECKEALVRARLEADKSGTQVGSRHIVSAILHQKTSAAARLLREYALDFSCLQSNPGPGSREPNT
jgi:hypothetical protein